uniref:Sleeping Beauty transposase HTH domain-containing protein n=1 Tax=Oncorhynchus tshawytscha TaxID=74940 RepID=A0AAZ3R4L2_ONCTS
GPTVDSACQSKNQATRFKELSAELRGRIVSRHRSGEGYQHFFAVLKVPKNTVASILKWKNFRTTKTLPRAGRPTQLSNRGRRDLVREVTKNLIARVPLWSIQDLRLGKEFTFQQDNNPKHSEPGQLRCGFVSQPEPRLEPNQTSLERPENSCAATLPIQPDRLRICREEWKNLPRYRCAKLVALYPRRVQAVITAKDPSTKY